MGKISHILLLFPQGQRVLNTVTATQILASGMATSAFQ